MWGDGAQRGRSATAGRQDRQRAQTGRVAGASRTEKGGGRPPDSFSSGSGTIKYDEVRTWRPHRPRRDKGGGQRRRRSSARRGARAYFCVHPTLNWLVGKSMVAIPNSPKREGAPCHKCVFITNPGSTGTLGAASTAHPTRYSGNRQIRHGSLEGRVLPLYCLARRTCRGMGLLHSL